MHKFSSEDEKQLNFYFDSLLNKDFKMISKESTFPVIKNIYSDQYNKIFPFISGDYTNDKNVLSQLMKRIKEIDEDIFNIYINKVKEYIDLIKDKYENDIKNTITVKFSPKSFYEEIGKLIDLYDNIRINNELTYNIDYDKFPNIDILANITKTEKVFILNKKTLKCIDVFKDKLLSKLKKIYPDQYKEFLKIKEIEKKSTTDNTNNMNIINNIFFIADFDNKPMLKLLFIKMILKSIEKNNNIIYFRSSDFGNGVDTSNFNKLIKQLIDLGYISKTNKKFTYKINQEQLYEL